MKRGADTSREPHDTSASSDPAICRRNYISINFVANVSYLTQGTLAPL